jgi:hypothetical protein
VKAGHRLIPVILFALLQLSCAAGNLTPVRESMPAARAALRPEFRLFYDALQDYGDWTLIEPYGYVFRPSVNFVAWRPYDDGFWAPSDLYGWVWISAEPFGWATYHYGQWFYDRFQGWVWMPGVDWGPAWVDWQQAGDYVGWTPLVSRTTAMGTVPNGAYRYVAVADLGSTNLSTRIHPATDLGDRLTNPAPIENFVRRDGVTFNRGPDIAAVERKAGPLGRARIQDALKSPVAGAPRSEAGGTSSSASTGTEESELVRRAAEAAARAARTLTEQDARPPDVIMVVRPAVVPPASAAAPAHAPKAKRPAARRPPADPPR